MFHKLNRAQIAVICRHKLHDRIIVLCAEYESGRGRVEIAADRPKFRDSGCERALQIVVFTELQRINKHGFRYMYIFNGVQPFAPNMSMQDD